MADIDQVKYDIERCISHVPDACRDCSHYWDRKEKDGDFTAIDCMEKLLAEAYDLLKEQEPRVMTLDELKEIYVEFKGDNCPIRLTNFDLQKIVEYAVDGECRLWKGKPTDEQRKAVKWE